MILMGDFGSGAYGVESYGSGEGEETPVLAVMSALALTPHALKVVFSAALDYVFPPLLDPSNYVIPGLTVTGVQPGGSDFVLVQTSTQSYQSYTVTVVQALGLAGEVLSPILNAAVFTGQPEAPGAKVVATRSTRVRVVFTEAMLSNAALTNPASYSLVSVTGSSVTVLSVQPEQGSDVLSVVLLLGSALQSSQGYTLTLSASLVTLALGLEVYPKTHAVKWIEHKLTLTLQASYFSGETTAGLLGEHGGLVFFSPALEAAAGASLIKVDDVSVCTTAYDTYKIPELKDPIPLRFWGNSRTTTRIGSAVFWSATRLSDVHFDFTITHEDAAPLAVDGFCEAVLEQTTDPDWVSRFNSPGWRIGAISSSRVFRFAKLDAGPIPPGPTTVITIVPP